MRTTPVVRGLAVVLAVAAILAWAFAEWIIVGLCGGITTCPSSSWGGYYVPLQAVLALIGVGSSFWLILLALEKRPLRPAFLTLVASAALWAVVVEVQAA